jgi:hypothetical protein
VGKIYSTYRIDPPFAVVPTPWTHKVIYNCFVNRLSSLTRVPVKYNAVSTLASRIEFIGAAEVISALDAPHKAFTDRHAAQSARSCGKVRVFYRGSCLDLVIEHLRIQVINLISELLYIILLLYLPHTIDPVCCRHPQNEYPCHPL